MNARVLIPVFAVLISSCQSALPFYTKTAEEPEWFKAKAAEADAKGYPATRAVPPRPKGLTPAAKRDAELKALQRAGEEVRTNPRAAMNNEETVDPEAFVKKAQKETKAPPLIDDEERPQ
ncbi:MAG: hypothetical protein COA85_10575 [Robiginitomaculum sp.]|nr:MAG: hypothetical protein COA85_10575 [Robiginitomaculum sp.]